ncbi:hypothetical protein PRUPE_2G095500 [Prunus persica]|uniref:Uncharacterized protein n=1 Tax=Prunus persica TaxID=3760 RepID=M5X585_PRUPE|nr:hypothetical protein PRUPE_2G095500 [Prunus persica]
MVMQGIDGYKELTEIRALNHTNLVLIPKIQEPLSISEYRPISLCNFSYKILSKVLANRIKPLLPMIISQAQSAFVAERQIHDNILIAYEVFHFLKLRKAKKSFEMGIKLDMNKAYDRVEWNFLREVMLKMGFRSRWVHLIMRFITTVTFSVVLNGQLGKKFMLSRGIRQGDPFSPYRFL